MNHKNVLQEFCQKNKLLLPEYSTNKTNNHTNNNREFISEVKIIYNNIEYIVMGSYQTNKKAAEKSAAAAMLIRIETIREKEIKHYSSDNQIYILIDLENVHIGDYFDLRRFGNNYHFVGFAIEAHASLKNIPSWLSVETIKSDRRDAADTLIIGYAAVLVNKLLNGKKEHHELIIVTKDHFGPSLVDYITHVSPNFKSRTIKSLNDLK